MAALRAALSRAKAAVLRASARRDELHAQLDARVLLPAWLRDVAAPVMAEYFGEPMPAVCAALADGLAGAPVAAERLERSEYDPIDVTALNYVWRGAARTCEEWSSLSSTDIFAMQCGEGIWDSDAFKGGNAVVCAAEDLKCMRGAGAGAEARVLKKLQAVPQELWLPALALSAFDFPRSPWWKPPPELLTGKRLSGAGRDGEL